MPIYEYQCSKCEHRMEALQKISDAPLTDCPVCHESSLQKLISAASFRLKGGGWYETDFKTEGRKQLAESDSTGKDAKSETTKDSTAKDKKDTAAKPEASAKSPSDNSTAKAKPAADK